MKLTMVGAVVYLSHHLISRHRLWGLGGGGGAEKVERGRRKTRQGHPERVLYCTMQLVEL